MEEGVKALEELKASLQGRALAENTDETMKTDENNGTQEHEDEDRSTPFMFQCN